MLLPSSDMLELIYLSSEESFFFSGAFMYCSDVRNNIFEQIDYSFDYSDAYLMEDERCGQNPQVMQLSAALTNLNREFVFWYNFNDWLAEVLSGLTCSKANG
jgi:hypothetical protein